MDACSRPIVDYPTRVPLKILGREGELVPKDVAALILEYLGPQPEPDLDHTTNRKGRYLSYTFWVTLPDAEAEGPLRAAIQKLPGYVMQL